MGVALAASPQLTPAARCDPRALQELIRVCLDVVAQFDVPKTLKDAGVPRNEIGEIVDPITHELEHMGVVDRPLTKQEVLALLEACY